MEKQPPPRGFEQMSFLEMKAYYDQELIQNSQVDAELQQAFSARETEIRLVLLGSRHSGKTTLAKSLCVRHGGMFAATSDREAVRRRVRTQLYEAIASLLEYAKDNGVTLPDAPFSAEALRGFASDGKFAVPANQIAAFITKDEVLNALINFRATNCGSCDNLCFYAGAAENILSSNYTPCPEDCIMLQEQDPAVKDFVSGAGPFRS